MGQIKNIKLHIVTDIKTVVSYINTSSIMALRLLTSTAFRQSTRLSTVRYMSTSSCLLTSKNKAHSRTVFSAATATPKDDNDRFPTDLEGLTGPALAELEAIHAGHADPWCHDLEPTFERGTKDNPIIVKTQLEERIVGCVCDPDSSAISWISLKLGDPVTRCHTCGNAFKLEKGNPFLIEQ